MVQHILLAGGCEGINSGLGNRNLGLGLSEHY